MKAPDAREVVDLPTTGRDRPRDIQKPRDTTFNINRRFVGICEIAVVRFRGRIFWENLLG